MMKKAVPMKSKKGVIPAGYADGGKAHSKKAMEQVATKKVKQHEAAMHGKKAKPFANGGMAKKGKC